MFVLGLDGLSPKILENFVKLGILPNFKKIMENGGFSKALPAIPTQTPENWATIATGAWPGTHGIAVWGRHDEGNPIIARRGEEAMSSNLCRAEYIWEAASKEGLKSVLLYFIGYPPTAENVIHIDWLYQPNRYFFDIVGPMCYSSFVPKNVDKDVVEKRNMFSLISIRKAERWRNIPKSFSYPLEADIVVNTKFNKRNIHYHILIIDSSGNGYDKIILAKERDCKKALCILKEGEWSKWFKEVFKISGRRIIATVRFKLIEISKNGSRLKLYRSQIYPITGFTHPPNLAEELVKNFGPYINDAVGRLYLLNLIDEETFLEEFEYQINWIVNAAFYCMEKYDASLYIMHWHFLDTLHHSTLGFADPVGGKYDPKKVDEAMHRLKLGYRIADKLVGKFFEKLDKNSYLIIVSDHGDVPNRKMYSIVRKLAEKGLICIEKDEKGNEVINWSKSKIFIDLTNIYVNLKSRYRDGIVSDEEYEDIRGKVIDILRSCKDDDGEYAILFALRREDAPIIGLWGPYIGDIVFVYNHGFTWGVKLSERISVKVGGANHGPQPPTSETDFSSNYATFIIFGPGIKKNYVRPIDFLGPIFLVDIAPTISFLLGIRPPKHSQGKILYDFLEKWNIDEMKREEKLTIPIELMGRLEGDVTDQL